MTLSDGRELTFRLKGAQLTKRRMRKLRRDLIAGGAQVLDSPSLDLFGRFEAPQGPQAPS